MRGRSVRLRSTRWATPSGQQYSLEFEDGCLLLLRVPTDIPYVVAGILEASARPSMALGLSTSANIGLRLCVSMIDSCITLITHGKGTGRLPPRRRGDQASLKRPHGVVPAGEALGIPCDLSHMSSERPTCHHTVRALGCLRIYWMPLATSLNDSSQTQI